MNKSGEYLSKDEDKRIAKGILLVPDYVDSQGDFFTRETIEREAQEFLTDVMDGEAEIKLMHTEGAGEKISLVESSVLTSNINIGGTTYPAGSWFVSVKVHDDDLWQLFVDDVITGFSIGADDFDAEEMQVREADVDLSGDFESQDEIVTQITEADIDEFSPVDMPAVQPAKVQVLKSTEKGHVEDIMEGRQSAVEALMERGHSQEDAERLVDVIYELPDMNGKAKTKAIEDIDTVPPQQAQEHAQDALDIREETGNPEDCGTPVGWSRARDISNGESLSEDTIDSMVRFLSSHLAQAGSLNDIEKDSCQYMMIKAWGARPALEWAEGKQEEFAEEREKNITEEKHITNMNKQEYETGTWVTWQRSEGDTRGQIVDVETEEGEGFEQAISGDVRVEAEEENPVYLIEVWDGFGDDASAREDETGRGDTMHVANREDQIVQEVGDPRDRESLFRAVKSMLFDSDEEDDNTEIDITESKAQRIMSKAGRTLSNKNVKEAKAVHDATERMLRREDVKAHSGDVRTYTMDKSDDFDITDKYKSAEMEKDNHIPMLYFPTEEGAERYAEEELGAEGSHPHMLHGQQFYMPVSTHSEYETLMSDKQMDSQMRGEIAEVVREVVGEMMEQGMHQGGDMEQGGHEEMEQGGHEEDKSSEVAEKLDELSEKIDEIDERVDRVAKSNADTGQTAGKEKSVEDEDDKDKATVFKQALGGGDSI